MRIFFIFVVIFISFNSYAEGPTKTSRYLMNDSFSMFEWGMLKLEEEINNYLREENKKALECEDDFYKIKKERGRLYSVLKKDYKNLTPEEKLDVDLLKIDEDAYQTICKHFLENGKVVGYYMQYDFSNDLINIIFGQNYNKDTEKKHFETYYRKDNKEKEAFYLSTEKCDYNRKKIVSDLFFASQIGIFDYISRKSDEEIDNDVDYKYSKLRNMFTHQYWSNKDEPEDLTSHLYNIVRVGVIVGEGFRDQKSIICWENIRTSNSTFKIGVQPEIIAEFFDYDDENGLFFLGNKDKIFSRIYN